MSQSTLDDEDLLGEAASEIREDVETNLAAARKELPAADEIWETDADNTLGVLNSLKSALDTGEAADRLRDARKWFMVGERADAFEDPDALEEELAEVAELIETIKSAQEDLTRSSHKLAEAMYAKASQAKGAGAGAGPGADAGGHEGPKKAQEDVVDADYEDVKDK